MFHRKEGRGEIIKDCDSLFLLQSGVRETFVNVNDVAQHRSPAQEARLVRRDEAIQRGLNS